MCASFADRHVSSQGGLGKVEEITVQEFGVSSLTIHQAQCTKRREAQQKGPAGPPQVSFSLHNYISHNCIGHSYIGHNYLDHN